MFFDTHMHTDVSSDSRMTLPQALQAAEKKGLGIIVTEHMDLGYPVPGSFIFDVDDYFSGYGSRRDEKILLGIEIGMMMAKCEEGNELIADYPFDFVIGSIHLVDGQDIYQPDFYQGRTKFETYGRYFVNMAQCVANYKGIHALGHLDYICRYARYDDADIHYAEMSEMIDPVLKAAAERGLALEINTRRLDERTASLLLPIYRRFAESGGKMATIGSDAHRPEDIGKGLAEGLALAEAANLQAVYFKEGKPIRMK